MTRRQFCSKLSLVLRYFILSTDCPDLELPVGRMNLPVFCITQLFFLVYFRPVNCGKKAQIILEFKTESGTYEWNRNVLADISKLHSPLRSIFFLGDKRGHTLATLDLIIHIWSGTTRNYVEEIFQETDLRNSVVWVHIFQLQGQGKEMENVLLLFGSHMDLDDAFFKSSYGRFFATISSGFSVFVQEMFQNNSMLSLVRGSSLFHNIGHNDLPKPHVVVDVPFESDSGVCHDFTVQPSGKTIEGAREFLKNYEKLHQSEYWNATKGLVATYRAMPIAKTPKGSRIDGAAIVELAAAVERPMDTNSCSDIDVYENLDRNICKRSYQVLIQSLIASKASETEAKAKKSVDDFAKLCALRDENADLRGDVQRVVTEQNKLVNILRNLEEAKRRKMEAEKRKKQKAKRIQETRSEMEKEQAMLCKSREEAELEIDIQGDQYKITRKEIKLLEKELSKKEGGWLDAIEPALLRQRPDEEKFSNTSETGGRKGKSHDESDSWYNEIIQILTVVNDLMSNALKIRRIINNRAAIGVRGSCFAFGLFFVIIIIYFFFCR